MANILPPTLNTSAPSPNGNPSVAAGCPRHVTTTASRSIRSSLNARRLAHRAPPALARGLLSCPRYILPRIDFLRELHVKPKVAKLFTNGGSQAVRLPAEFRFDGDEVFIRRDAVTGDVI